MERALAVVLLLSGCSMVFTEKASKYYDYSAPPRCTDSAGLWTADGILVLAGAALIAGAIVADPEAEDPPPTAVLGIGMVVVNGISFFLGRKWVNRCRELGDGYDRRQRDTEARAVIPVPAGPSPLPSTTLTGPRWWCAATAAGEIGVCYEDDRLCQLHRERALVDGVTLGACEARRFAACYQYQAPDSTVRQACAPTIDLCRSMYGAARAVPTPLFGECRVVQ